MEISQRQNIFLLWFFWHFFEATKNLLKIWNNYFLFVLNYFSFLLLLKTLFTPWRRYLWEYPRGFNPKAYFEVFVSNLFSRLIGATIRSILILIGLIVLIFVLIFGSVIILIWLILPFLLILGLFFIL